MRSGVIMSLRFLLPATLLVIALPAAAWEGCRAHADRSADIDVIGVERIEVIAAAGDLEVYGGSDARTVRASGRACASDEEDLARVNLRTERDGPTIRVIAEIPPDIDNAWLDFRVDLPAGVPVSIADSSGDIIAKDIASLDLRDSSGDVQIDDVPGEISLDDSS